MTGTELAMAAAVFIAGGLVKGTLGIGLPLVVVPLLSHRVPATQAIVLVMMPVLVSNAWQSARSGLPGGDPARFVPLAVPLVAATLLTVPVTLALPDDVLRAIVGGAVLLTVLLLALPLKLSVPPERERWWSVGVGTLSGVMGGVSSLTGPIVISYLSALRLPRESFVRHISVIYLAGALALYGAMAAQGRVGWHELSMSTLALLPMGVGLAIGQRLRHRLSEALFRRAILLFLSGVALTLLFRP
ncbi:sulfite exporter TauE/SafE family protein [Caldimonas tepidiphila]|uniref:sulfite exporter TauE/SafE family protein n=1 Tax=Caldimonas tepidiphila TaxID=2315841 RepID=UPI001300874D|nr:sulfite exporter TauE/SafE family protein [Caldimonas tepidiphila]